MSSSSKDSLGHDRQRDIRRLAKMLRDGGYSYDQSKHLVAEARSAVGLTPPKRQKGSVDRLTSEEVDQLLGVTYEEMGATKGLIVRTLLERSAPFRAKRSRRSRPLWPADGSFWTCERQSSG